MTPEEVSAECDSIKAQINGPTPPDIDKLCARIHELLDIIGTDPAYEQSRLRLCGFIQQLGCDPHSACGE